MNEGDECGGCVRIGRGKTSRDFYRSAERLCILRVLRDSLYFCSFIAGACSLINLRVQGRRISSFMAASVDLLFHKLQF